MRLIISAKWFSMIVVTIFLLTSLTSGMSVSVKPNTGGSQDLVFAETVYQGVENQSVTIYEDQEYVFDVSWFLNVVNSNNGLMDSPWPMKCHDLHHTSRSPYAADDGGGLEKWRFNCGDWMEASAVIDDEGIIYFGSSNYYLYALYPNSTLKWKYKTGDIIWSSPALADDGTIYVGSWDRYLHAINPDGTRKWIVDLGAVTTSSPAIAPDGTVYLSTMSESPSGHSLVAVNPNGTIKWRYLTGDDMVSEPAVSNDGTIFVGSLDTYFYAIYPNGTLKWRFKTGDWVSASPAIASDGAVYISSFDSWLYALNPDNGSLLWKYTDGGDEASPAIGPDGIIYLGNNLLRALYPNGTLKYSVDLGPNIGPASPTLSTDGVLYLAGGKIIFAVNAENGTKIWQKQLANDYMDSSPIIGYDGTVYIGSSSHRLKSNGYYTSTGYLHAFGPVPSNTAPEPPVISGKPKGAAGEPQIYGLRTNDPQMNPVSFYIEWGDGNSTEWSGGGAPPKVLDECASGETVYFKHTYAEQGTYTIRAKARDTLGEESDWAYLTIEVPYGYQYPGWQWLCERFPLLVRIIDMLL